MCLAHCMERAKKSYSCECSTGRYLSWRENFEAIYLVRNEGHLRFITFRTGESFEPDFVLFLREKTSKLLTYQVFIEPKGKYLEGT